MHFLSNMLLSGYTRYFIKIKFILFTLLVLISKLTSTKKEQKNKLTGHQHEELEKFFFHDFCQPNYKDLQSYKKYCRNYELNITEETLHCLLVIKRSTHKI